MKYFGIKKDILATLAYFNMFDYPLRKSEIFIYLGHCDDYREFEKALFTLTKESLIYRIGDFYSLKNNYALAIRRYKGNEKARDMLKKAERSAKIIAAFPFVKGVAVSGSLSKYFADDKSDIDFFVITKTNRLWIARTLLHLFKKLTFLLKMQDDFCMNYFIDEAEPVILEKNIYTAIEIVTILPIRGTDIFHTFYNANIWTRNFFPNKYINLPPPQEINSSWLRRCAEKLFNNRFGDILDDYLMKLTTKRWDIKTRHNKKDKKGILMSIHSGKHFSKQNPELFQKMILDRYEKNLAEIFRQYELQRITE